ncbi:hypothetical protein MHYP_G00103880 [Metynnis hypsauchen]
MKILQLRMKIFIFTLYLIAGQVSCSDVFGYSGGSITLLPDLNWDVNHVRYMCKMEQSGCVNIIKDQTKSHAVTSGRFMIYSNTADKFTVLIRELSPQDSAVYRFGVGNEKHKDIKLTVQSDSCCGGITRIKAYLGETATFKCSYPDELKTNSKRLTNLKNQNTVNTIIYTGKEAEKEQKDRFSIFDDRRSKVFSVNISDVREDDGGVYLCGVWRKETSVGYYSYFREIQLQVTGETATFKCSYPDEFKTNYKYLINLNDQTIIKDIISARKASQKEQKGRFSIFDDRSSKVFSVNISDVREDDGGVYLCGVWRKDTSVGYYSYFREVQLQVTGETH